MKDRLSNVLVSSPIALVGSAVILVLVTIGVPYFALWVGRVFKAPYVVPFVITYLVFLFLMFLLFSRVGPQTIRLSLWRMLLFGMLFGYLSGIIGHSLHLVIVPGGFDLLANSLRTFPLIDYVLVAISFTTVLGLWVYGGIVGMTIWLLQRWALKVEG